MPRFAVESSGRRRRGLAYEKGGVRNIVLKLSGKDLMGGVDAMSCIERCNVRRVNKKN